MMRRNWIKALAFGLIAAVSGVVAQADPITTLKNTGHNTTDYVLTGPGGPLPVIIGSQAGSWFVPTPGMNADWIGPASGSLNGTYSYETTFTLPGDTVLGSVQISGMATADDMISAIYLNNVLITPGFSTPDPAFGSIYNFAINAASGNGFQTGSNTLRFVTQNTHGVVTGLLVSMSGNYNTSAVPEPASVAMLGLGVVGLAAARRFRGRRVG